jgi:Plasmid pRiA4b ORF-3-like protein
MFAVFRELDIESDPLEAELSVSRILGTMWRSRDADAEADEALSLGLVEYAAEQHTPLALALLRTFAVVSPDEAVRRMAAALAERLAGRGVREPHWPAPVGAVECGRCWVNEDVYGDQTSVICEYAYGEERHAIVVLVDHNLFGIAKSAFPVDRVDQTVRELRREAMKNGPMITLRDAEPAWARGFLERAFARLDDVFEPPIDEDLADWRAFTLARVRALPRSALGLPAEPRPLSTGQRRTLVRQFLRSPQARALAGSEVAEHLAGLIVDHGCDIDPGRPDRVSPIKWELFLLDFLPRTAMLDDEDRRLLPDVVRAWSTWAAHRGGLPAQAREEMAEAVEHQLALFDGEYDNPENFSPARHFLQGVDGSVDDINDALARRMMAMPYYGTRIGEDDYPRLNPGDPADMRVLVLGEHPEYHPEPSRRTAAWAAHAASAEHIALHTLVARQLWDGEPAQVWAAARGLAAGKLSRHEVLHRLCQILQPHVADLTAADPRVDLDGYVRALAGLVAVPTDDGRGGDGARSAVRRTVAPGPVAPSTGSYQLKISLRGAKPPIWRRVLVPAAISLADLHQIIQCAMGWQDSHLHLFEVGEERFGTPDPEDLLELRDERRARLCDVAPQVGARVLYEYDFGDSWEHDIVVEKVFDEVIPEAVCLAGRRACPPEDCGGIRGYERLLRVLADPADREHQRMLEWLGGEVIDPTALYLDEINAELKDLRLHRRR